ncbi:MAG: SpoIID/LytB domain-containing protein [Actinomycetales bacterium]|nr:SpoIID/LytB domain-containing protein [Actinomycetales bacterium]
MTPHGRRTWAWLTSAALVGSGLLAVLGVAARAADPSAETYRRPADGVYHLEGFGYGHGRGMSQWGARGAASLGVGYQEILRTYYPGTVPGAQPSRSLRVRLTGDDGVLEVLPDVAAGLRVAVGDADDAGGGAVLPERLGSCGVTRWRIEAVEPGLRLEGRVCGTWIPQPVDGRLTVSGPVTFATDAGRVRVVLGEDLVRTYRGTVGVAVDAVGIARTVNTVELEDYLRSVVPAEMPAGWPPDALRAQTVASRTYAVFDAATPGSISDTCDSTSCQVYRGVADHHPDGTLRARHEWDGTDEAVAATAGEILTYRGRPAFTQFSAANGGRSVAHPDHPYLPERDDPWDAVVANPATAWTRDVTVERLEASWPAIGRLEELRVRSRSSGGTWGGRVDSVRLEGSRGGVTLTGGAFRTELGLRSAWWHPRSDSGDTGSTGSTTTTATTSDGPTGPDVRRPGSTPPTFDARLVQPWDAEPSLQVMQRIRAGSSAAVAVSGLSAGTVAEVQMLPHSARSWQDAVRVVAGRDGRAQGKITVRTTSYLRVVAGGTVSDPVKVAATVRPTLTATSHRRGRVLVTIRLTPNLAGVPVQVFRVGDGGARTLVATVRTPRGHGRAGTTLRGQRSGARIRLVAVPLVGPQRRGVDSTVVPIRVR